MRITTFVGLVLYGLTACGRGNADTATRDKTRQLDPQRTDTVFAFNDQPPRAAAGTRTLAGGSRVEATWGRTISSHTNKAGETVTVIVTSDVKDDAGRVVIPSGATVALLIVALAPATTLGSADGTLVLRVFSTTIRGRSYVLHGTVTSVPHSLRERGTREAEVVKVNVSAAGTNGAGGGVGVASRTSSRDVVVSIGSRVLITLTEPFTLAGS